MRLIDADAVEFKVEYGYDNKGVLLVPYRDIKKSIAAAKTVDAVPVVRCRKCKHCRELNRKDRIEEAYADGVLWCMNQSDGVWPDDFCSYGERKDYD